MSEYIEDSEDSDDEDLRNPLSQILERRSPFSFEMDAVLGRPPRDDDDASPIPFSGVHGAFFGRKRAALSSAPGHQVEKKQRLAPFGDFNAAPSAVSLLDAELPMSELPGPGDVVASPEFDDIFVQSQPAEYKQPDPARAGACILSSASRITQARAEVISDAPWAVMDARVQSPTFSARAHVPRDSLVCTAAPTRCRDDPFVQRAPESQTEQQVDAATDWPCPSASIPSGFPSQRAPGVVVAPSRVQITTSAGALSDFANGAFAASVPAVVPPLTVDPRSPLPLNTTFVSMALPLQQLAQLAAVVSSATALAGIVPNVPDAADCALGRGAAFSDTDPQRSRARTSSKPTQWDDGRNEAKIRTILVHASGPPKPLALNEPIRIRFHSERHMDKLQLGVHHPLCRNAESHAKFCPLVVTGTHFHQPARILTVTIGFPSGSRNRLTAGTYEFTLWFAGRQIFASGVLACGQLGDKDKRTENERQSEKYETRRAMGQACRKLVRELCQDLRLGTCTSILAKALHYIPGLELELQHLQRALREPRPPGDSSPAEAHELGLVFCFAIYLLLRPCRTDLIVVIVLLATARLAAEHAFGPMFPPGSLFDSFLVKCCRKLSLKWGGVLFEQVEHVLGACAIGALMPC